MMEQALNLKSPVSNLEGHSGAELQCFSSVIGSRMPFKTNPTSRPMQWNSESTESMWICGDICQLIPAIRILEIPATKRGPGGRWGAGFAASSGPASSHFWNPHRSLNYAVWIVYILWICLWRTGEASTISNPSEDIRLMFQHVPTLSPAPGLCLAPKQVVPQAVQTQQSLAAAWQAPEHRVDALLFPGRTQLWHKNDIRQLYMLYTHRHMYIYIYSSDIFGCMSVFAGALHQHSFQIRESPPKKWAAPWPEWKKVKGTERNSRRGGRKVEGENNRNGRSEFNATWLCSMKNSKMRWSICWVW